VERVQSLVRHVADVFVDWTFSVCISRQLLREQSAIRGYGSFTTRTRPNVGK
jgi:hypothetical protein